MTISSIRFIAKDVVLVNIETKTGGRDSSGNELPIRRARGTWLLHRQNGNWLISAMRGMPTEKDSVVLGSSIENAKSLRPHIRAFVDAYEDAINAHDPSAVGAFYTDDADFAIRNSPVIYGRQAIIDWWRTFFSQPRLYRAILIIDEIRMLEPSVALIGVTVTGAVPQADTALMPVRYSRATWVAVHEGNEWLITTHRVLPSEDDRVIRASGN